MHAILPFLIVIFFAGFTQGLSGFGSVLVSLPLLALFLDIKTVIPLMSLYGLVISTILLISLRKDLNIKELLLMLAGTVPGIPVGVFLLNKFPASALQYALGGILVLFGAYALFLKPPVLNTGRISKTASGFLAGCLGGSIGASGPPVIIYTAVQPWTKNEIKSCLTGYFIITGAGISLTHAAYGLITHEVLTYFFAGLISLVLGVLAGNKMYGKINEAAYKKAISALILMMGTIMVLKPFL